MKIEKKLRKAIREVRDIKKKGISFKDITPLMKDQNLTNEIIDNFKKLLSNKNIDAVVGIESRGFLFGMLLSNALNVPFVPIRKKGKLPCSILSQSYELEYGEATIEIHSDSLEKNWNVLVHDDLLATGGTALAASKLIERLGAKVCAFAFVVELDFLNGKEDLKEVSNTIISLIKY